MKRLIGAALGVALFGSAALAGTYAALNYNTAGGAVTEIGGTLEVLSGGIFRMDVGTKTATAVSGAATLSKLSGVVTSEALTTAALGTYTLTITNTRAAVGDQVFTSVANGTNTAGLPDIATTTVGAGTITVVVQNAAASGAFNGTLKLSFMVVKN